MADINASAVSGSRGRLPIILVLVAALAAGLGLLASQWWLRPSAPPSSIPEGLQGTLLYPAPRPLPAFSLDAGSGGGFDLTALQGRWTLVFIGFTHCPDICPTTLALLGQAAGQWNRWPLEQRPQVLFVAVDPERDTASRALDYARHFHPDFLAASADAARLEAFTRSIGMVFMKSALEGDNYTVDHSSSLAVIDPQARLVGLMRPPLAVGRVLNDLQILTGAAR